LSTGVDVSCGSDWSAIWSLCILAFVPLGQRQQRLQRQGRCNDRLHATV
jgi:hypothetical protein